MAELEASATGAQTEDASAISISFRAPAIAFVLAFGLAFRLILATLPGFGVDLGTFQAWANQLAAAGPWNFYDTDFFVDYAPGYLYVLWLIGGLHKLFNFTPEQYEYVLKLPAIAADVAAAFLLYKILDSQKLEIRLGAAALYLLFPAGLLIGAVWGQVDSLLAFLLLLSLYFIAKDRPVWGGVAFVVAFLVKPQGIAALPFLVFWIVRHYPPRVWAGVVAASVIAGLALLVPFFTYKPWELYDRLRFSADVYQYSSVNAYNFWGMYDGLFRPDNVHYLGITYQVWGIILFAGAVGAILVAMARGRGTGALALGTALSMFAFYIFVTRMHERYVFPAFLPLLVACVLLHSRTAWSAYVLWGTFIVLGVVHFLNLYYVYSYYPLNFPPAGGTPDQPWFHSLYDLIKDKPARLDGTFLLSLLATVTLPLLIAAGFFLSQRSAEEPEPA